MTFYNETAWTLSGTVTITDSEGFTIIDDEILDKVTGDFTFMDYDYALEIGQVYTITITSLINWYVIGFTSFEYS